jgi:hypothetical protein
MKAETAAITKRETEPQGRTEELFEQEQRM